MISPEESSSEKKKLSEFEKCLKLRNLISFEPSDELLAKEITTAEYDLKRAEESLEKEDFKWAAIQAYYSICHSVRVMVLSQGYKDETHHCLLVALKELYVSIGRLEKFVVDNFEMCIEIKNECDAGIFPDIKSSKMCIESAKNFLIFAIEAA